MGQEENTIKLESKFQSELIKEIKEIFPGCIVLKNDPNYIQGFPDLTVLYHDRWAVLEVKRDSKAREQPNQQYYIEKAHEMGFAAKVFPENKEEVLDELQRSFRPSR